MVLVAGYCGRIRCYASAEDQIHEMVGQTRTGEEESSAREMG